MKSVSVVIRTPYLHYLKLLVLYIDQTGVNQWLDLAQESFWRRQQLGMIYYLIVMGKFGCSMLYLILTPMIMEPCLMDDSVETLDGDIVIKFKKILVE